MPANQKQRLARKNIVAGAAAISASGLFSSFKCFLDADTSRTIIVPAMISFNREWDFTYVPAAEAGEALGILPTLPTDFSAKMPVPGYWDDHWDNLKRLAFWSKATFNPDYKALDFPMGYRPNDASFPYLKSIGFYRRRFDIAADWGSRSVTLNIGGARFESWVWINGRFVGYHFLHNVPFEVSLGEFIKPGEKNELIIAVGNNGKLRVLCDNRGWQEGAAGIYRWVSLTVSAQVRVADCYVYPLDSNNKLKWNVTMQDRVVKGSYLDWSIYDRSDKSIGMGRINVAEQFSRWETGTFGMRPWSPKAPNLYRLKVKLVQPDGVSDTISQSFGLRTIVRDGNSLRLNNKLIQLRGLCDHHYFPMERVAPVNVEYYRQSIIRYKQLGFNWIRWHTFIPNEDYMQAADEMRIMFQVEGSGEYTEKDWAEVMLVCRKHPSVVLYFAGNEETLHEHKIGYLKGIAAQQKSLASDALFNPQEALPGVEYRFEDTPIQESDIVDHPFQHNKRRLEALKEFSDVFGQYSWGQLSYTAVKADWKDLDKKMVVYERPLLSHENGIYGNYIDLDLENVWKSGLWLTIFNLLHKIPIYGHDFKGTGR